jgi:hypothetical protein
MDTAWKVQVLRLANVHEHEASLEYIALTSYRTEFEITDGSQITRYAKGCETKKSIGERDDCHPSIS